MRLENEMRGKNSEIVLYTVKKKYIHFKPDFTATKMVDLKTCSVMIPNLKKKKKLKKMISINHIKNKSNVSGSCQIYIAPRIKLFTIKCAFLKGLECDPAPVFCSVWRTGLDVRQVHVWV